MSSPSLFRLVLALPLLLTSAGEAQSRRFMASSSPLTEEQKQRMTGVSWRPGCPVALEDLSLLDLPHWGFDGREHRGQLVVASAVADQVIEVFRRLHQAKFPIEKMRLVEEYGGDDEASMNDNNTSAFNCRAKTGGGSFSEHAHGRAVDINTVQNPWVRQDRVLPVAGEAYRNRRLNRKGMIVSPGPVIDAFRAIGWRWGGSFAAFKDYQHFSETGR